MGKSRFATALAVAAVLIGGMALAGEAWAQKANKPAKPEGAGRAGQNWAQAEGSRPLFRCFFDNMAIRRQLKEKLNLTDDQLQKIRAIMQAHKEEIAAALKSLNETHKALLAAVRADHVDEGAIKAAADRMGDAIGSASVLRAKIRQEVLAVLTPEQRTQVDQALDEIQNNRDEAVNEIGNK